MTKDGGMVAGTLPHNNRKPATAHVGVLLLEEIIKKKQYYWMCYFLLLLKK